SLVRRVDLPSGVRAIAVGGATLGGSGKTPLAIAAALALSAAGARVAFVGHAYRARPGRGRGVTGGDPSSEGGDGGRVAARALPPAGVPVLVGPARADAIALAGSLADVLVLDGVAQTAPAPAALALLALDATAPWGRPAAVPPAGDLRAPRAALLAAC